VHHRIRGLDAATGQPAWSSLGHLDGSRSEIVRHLGHLGVCEVLVPLQEGLLDVGREQNPFVLRILRPFLDAVCIAGSGGVHLRPIVQRVVVLGLLHKGSHHLPATLGVPNWRKHSAVVHLAAHIDRLGAFAKVARARELARTRVFEVVFNDELSVGLFPQ
jgi:hypothetical protein